MVENDAIYSKIAFPYVISDMTYDTCQKISKYDIYDIYKYISIWTLDLDALENSIKNTENSLGLVRDIPSNQWKTLSIIVNNFLLPPL